MKAFFFYKSCPFCSCFVSFCSFFKLQETLFIEEEDFYSFLYKNKENNQTAKDETNQRKNKGKQKGNYCRQPFV